MNNINTKETDEIDWKLILFSWDTAKYLSRFDLIDFSLICKFIRNKLFKILYKNIYLKNFSDGLDDLPLDVNNLDLEKEGLNRYKEHLKDFIPHARCLIYEFDYNEILLLSIPQVFCKLNRLQLIEISFTLTAFHKLMSGLRQLEYLSLEYSLFIIPESANTPITLRLPPSLIAFKILYGELMQIEFDSNLIFSDYLESYNGSSTTNLKFKIESGSLPKLKVLEIDQDNDNFMETQDKLISTSERLNHFSTRFSLITEFSSGNLKSLTSLTLKNNYIFPDRLHEFDFPVFQNLKELRIKGGFNLEKYDEVIILALRKLVSISKNVEKLYLPYIQYGESLIEETIQSFSNLNELSLVKADNVKTLSPTKFPKSIKILNLYNFELNTLDINNVKGCPELKYVSISFEDYRNLFKFEDTKFSSGVKGWRIIHFYGSSIKCYKE